MPNPALPLAAAIRTAVAKAFGQEHFGTNPAVRRSAHADYQADVALGLAKRLSMPPREVAARIVEQVDLFAVCSKVDIAGPGFINLQLSDAYLIAQINEAARASQLRIELQSPRQTVVIDYSSPNVAKEMHVGHLRGTIIGDALARVLEAVGHRVVRQNHIGDWGTPFGMLVEHLIDIRHSPDADVLLKDLDGYYRDARAKFDADPAFAERARRRVVLLQGGDKETLSLWRELVSVSINYMNRVYRSLDVELSENDIAGESLYNPTLPKVVGELAERGLAIENRGALCVFPAGFAGKDGAPLPLIVRKQDGGYNYAATDLAAIRHRVDHLGAHRLLYVIGAPQTQHLAMVFATAREVAWVSPDIRLEHVAFGSILGPDRKPFKSRSGDNIKLVELIEEALIKAGAVVREKNAELDAETVGMIAHAVGVGAIKYADLSTTRTKDYVFDWDRMLTLEGNTAPYLMYAHARIRSMLRKAEDWSAETATIQALEPAERALVVELLNCEPVIHEVADSLEPHRLCGYLYGLAVAFTAFYNQCPVLRADTPQLQQARLLLCWQTARVLSHHLHLLGIEAPERM